MLEGRVLELDDENEELKERCRETEDDSSSIASRDSDDSDFDSAECSTGPSEYV